MSIIRRTVLITALLSISAAGPAAAQIWVKTALDKKITEATGGPFRTLRTPQTCSGFLPANDGKGKCFWQQETMDFLTAADFVSTPGTVSTTAEIVSDLAGPVRLAASSAVVGSTGRSDAKDEDAERNLNLLRANGGNLALSGTYPVYLSPDKKVRFAADLMTRAAANVSALGGTNANDTSSVDFDKLSANTEVSLETRTRLMSDTNVFAFSLYTRTGGVAVTKLLRQTIGAKRSAFLIGEGGLSARVGQLFTIGLTWGWYSDDGIPRKGGAFHIAFVK